MECITSYVPDYTEDFTPTREDELGAHIQQLRDEADLANRKATAVQKLLNGWPLSNLTIPTERLLIEWMVKGLFDEAVRTQLRISELEGDDRSRRDRLAEERRMLHKAWVLHADKQDSISRRESEIEAELEVAI